MVWGQPRVGIFRLDELKNNNLGEKKILLIPPKDATFLKLFFKIRTVHFREGVINEGGGVSMLHQVTEKEGGVGHLLCRAQREAGVQIPFS